jgi:hypothetical protein
MALRRSTIIRSSLPGGAIIKKTKKKPYIADDVPNRDYKETDGAQLQLTGITTKGISTVSLYSPTAITN